jgi:hypothetical protein
MSSLTSTDEMYLKRQVVMEASSNDVRNVLEDLKTYTLWTGRNIKSVNVKDEGYKPFKGSMAHLKSAYYNTIILGFRFLFELKWAFYNEPNSQIYHAHFHLVKKTRMLFELQGEYTIQPYSASSHPTTCKVSFKVKASLARVIPPFLQNKIKLRVANLAMGDLKRYCDFNPNLGQHSILPSTKKQVVDASQDSSNIDVDVAQFETLPHSAIEELKLMTTG